MTNMGLPLRGRYLQFLPPNPAMGFGSPFYIKKENRMTITDDLIKNMQSDINDVGFAFEKGQISGDYAIEKIRNLCFFFLKESYDKK